MEAVIQSSCALGPMEHLISHPMVNPSNEHRTSDLNGLPAVPKKFPVVNTTAAAAVVSTETNGKIGNWRTPDARSARVRCSS